MPTPEQQALLDKLKAMSPAELEIRRRAIVDAAKGDYEAMSVPTLEELSYITSTLRTRSVGPPKAKAAPKVKANIDSLLEGM